MFLLAYTLIKLYALDQLEKPKSVCEYVRTTRIAKSVIVFASSGQFLQSAKRLLQIITNRALCPAIIEFHTKFLIYLKNIYLL